MSMIKHVCMSLEFFAALAFHEKGLYAKCIHINIELETASVYIKRSSRSRSGIHINSQLSTCYTSLLYSVNDFVVVVIFNAHVVCDA